MTSLNPKAGVEVLDKAAKVKFPEPSQHGGAPVEHCIRQRRSVRAFRDRKLTKDELGQLLWAAQGVTASDGRRAVSSAGALYPLEVYAVCGDVGELASGVYRYTAKHHELLLVTAGHQRQMLVDAAWGQEWIASAPAVICIAAAFERTMLKYGNRGRGYVYWRRVTQLRVSCCKRSPSVLPPQWWGRSAMTKSSIFCNLRQMRHRCAYSLSGHREIVEALALERTLSVSIPGSGGIKVATAADGGYRSLLWWTRNHA
jgi:hypothetical protein